MRISDWSSDVCSSDLIPAVTNAVDTTPDRGEDDDDQQGQPAQGGPLKWPLCDRCTEPRTKHNMYQGHAEATYQPRIHGYSLTARKSVVSGKRVSVRVDLGGRRTR